MKKFKSLFSISILLLALVVSFAFRPVAKHKNAVLFTGRLFQFTGTPGTADEKNPLLYTDVTGSFIPEEEDVSSDCPLTRDLCAIFVVDAEIYTSGNAPSGHSNYANHPMVDDLDANSNAVKIDDDIDQVDADHSKEDITPLASGSDNIIYRIGEED